MQQSTVESNYSASVSVSLNGDETDSDPRTALEREIKFKTFVSKNTCIKYIWISKIRSLLTNAC